MKKKVVRITESELHKIIKESIKKILREGFTNEDRNSALYMPYDDFEDEEYVDKKGHPIKVGSQVIWYDPEKSARDVKRVWTVDDMRGDIVYISDKFSEAEVYPQELVVVG